jgi:hypothetical protein
VGDGTNPASDDLNAGPIQFQFVFDDDGAASR